MTAAAFATLWHVQQVERDIAAAFVARDDPLPATSASADAFHR